MADTFEPDLSILDNYEDDDTNTPLVKHLRAELKRLAKAGKAAEESGRKAASQEFEQRQARQAALADVPPALHGLFSDIDPTDTAAKTAKLEQLQQSGITWGQSEQQPPASAEQPSSLDRMAQVAAGGSIPNSDDDRAQKIKQQIDAGRGYASDDDQAFFEGYVETSRQALTQARSRGM